MLDTRTARAEEVFLDNGLKVVLVPIAGAPVAALMVVYRVGARNEAVGYTGSSHLLEHMLFKGTRRNNRREGRAFADMMNEIGANKNATTWLDRTNYFETVPSGYLEFAIELEADRMRGALVADADRRSEMTVVRNELERNDNNLTRVLHTAVVAAAFREHPYHHPTIGWRSDVEGVSTERLRDLYDTYYRPDNATVFVVGEFDAERTFAAIERHFGALAHSTIAIPDVYTEEPPQAGERSVVVKRPGEVSLVALAFHTPAAFGQTTVFSRAELDRIAASGVPSNDDGYALDLLARVLARGRTSRLSRALVDTGLALDVSASNWGTRDPGLFNVFAQVRPGVAAGDVRDEMLRTIEALVSEGPSADELERAQRQAAVARAFGNDGAHAVAQRLAELEAVGSWRLDEGYQARIDAVTVDQVREVAAAYLHDDNRTAGMLVSGTAKTFDVVPFSAVDERLAVDAAAEPAALPVPRTHARTPFAARVSTAELANGTRARYVSTPNTSTVVVRALFEAGPAFSLDRPMLPILLAEMLSRGTVTTPRTEIEARLERSGSRRTYYVDDDRTTTYDPVAFRLSAACAAGDLEELLVTIAEEVRAPAFDQAEFALVRADVAGALHVARTNTAYRATQQFLAMAYDAGDANYEYGVEALLADLAETTLDDLRAYHATLLGKAPIVSAAGAPSDVAFAALLEESLGGVAFAGTVRPLPPRARRSARAERSDVALERKANVDVVIGRATRLVRADGDYDAAMLANAMLGRSTLSSRLGLRLREREGLTYGVTSAFVSASRMAGPWRIALGVNPANVDRAVVLAKDVLEAFASDPPPAREIEQQRNALAGHAEVSLANNGGIASVLEQMAYYGLADDFVDTYRGRLEAIGPAQIETAIGNYFGTQDLVVVAAGTLLG